MPRERVVPPKMRTCRRPARGFTLVELLVVVAVVTLLISILLPSMARAREAAKGVVCANNIRQLITGGNLWLSESTRDRSPAHRGWATFVYKVMSGQGEPFTCPSDINPSPIPAISLRGYKPGVGDEGGGTDRGQSMDSAYCVRYQEASGRNKNRYVIGVEGEYAKGTGGDADYNDYWVSYVPDGPRAKTGTFNARRDGTNHNLVVYDWQGRILERTAAQTATYPAPILWGSYAMNLSSAMRGARPQQMLYLEYLDWAAVVEPEFQIARPPGWKFTSNHPRWRSDEPAQMAAVRHNRRLNVGFLDGHVDRVAPARVSRPAPGSPNAIWHPTRPPGWQPPAAW